MSHVLADHELHNLTPVSSWPQAQALAKHTVALAVLGIESGFETEDAAVIGEQDILGDRLVRPRRAQAPRREFHRRSHQPRGRRPRRACRPRHRPFHRPADDRGRRRAARLPRDRLRRRAPSSILPVENIELLSRYGSEESGVELDRLGGGDWQARKARMKARILRDGRRPHQDRGRAAIARGAAPDGAERRLRRILRRASPTRKPKTS